MLWHILFCTPVELRGDFYDPTRKKGFDQKAVRCPQLDPASLLEISLGGRHFAAIIANY
jgi:hypothetical protein